MEKKFLMMAAIAGMLAACSNDADPVQEAAEVAKQNTQVAQQVPVEFGAYVNRATTRSGEETGPMILEKLQTADKGFGVIAYYTDDDLYSQIYQPNFMYNTHVTYSSGSWSYSPVRYWPNETGSSAISDGVDRLSFFAYAPYVAVTPETGIVSGSQEFGIMGLSRNAAVGDPFVKYYVNLDPNNQVDFCWGVADQAFTSSVDGTANGVAAGSPYLNLMKVKTGDKIKFDFHHALASLNVQIDAAVDATTPGTALASETKIYVRKVTFEGFVTQGSFNLNSKYSATLSPAWYDLAGSSYINSGFVTIYDGRTDGREGASPASNESPTGLNSAIIQSNTSTDGVTETAVNLLTPLTSGSDEAKKKAPIYVIPSGQPLKVTIVYDVETTTEELATLLSDGSTYGTSVQNTITKTIEASSTPLKLEAGKAYTVNLHLGLTSVKFDAKVTEDWGTGSNGEASLPANVS